MGSQSGVGGGGDGSTYSKIFVGFVVLVATLLPAGVAGQSMACDSSNPPNSVLSSDATLALFNNITPLDITFTKVVHH